MHIFFLVAYQNSISDSLQKIGKTKYSTTGSLYNTECTNQASPAYCPNQWKYIDANDEWKIDDILQVNCGKKITNTRTFA